jgi:MFS transporter, DHA3 family, macrolide efflux protein
MQIERPKNMKNFFIIWLGQVISMIGSGLTTFALSVWIFQETQQATPFAMAVLMGTLPRLLLTPLAGSLADRWNRRWLMILSDTAIAAGTLVIAFLVFGGRLEIWHIYIVIVFSSAFAAFQEPAYAASIPMLVPKKELGRANGMVQMTQGLEMLAAPVLAGFLFVTIGLRGIIIIDFITFFFAVGALFIVRIPQPKLVEEDVSQKRGQVWRDAAFGWRYLRARVGLFRLLVYFALVNFLLNFATVLTGPLILSFSSADTLGLVQMTMGVGMLIGSLIMSAWGGMQRRMLGVFIFIALAGVGLGIAGLRPSPLTIAAGLALLLFSIPFGSGMSAAVFQSKVAPAVQGRVFAIRGMISRSAMPLAFLLAGPLADFVFNPLMETGGALAATPLGLLLGAGPGRGIGLLFLLSSFVLLVATAVAYTNPRIRHIESELPDALPEIEVQPASVPAPAD